MNDAEIAGYMDWRGPGAYTERQLVRIRRIVDEVRRREREACAKLCDNILARCIAKDVADPPLEHIADAIRAMGRDAA